MLSTTREVTTVALLTAVGIALFVIESFVPTPLPFLKIGFANISSVVAIMSLGVPQMFIVVMLRVVIGSLLVGMLRGGYKRFIIDIGGNLGVHWDGTRMLDSTVAEILIRHPRKEGEFFGKFMMGTGGVSTSGDYQ